MSNSVIKEWHFDEFKVIFDISKTSLQSDEAIRWLLKRITMIAIFQLQMCSFVVAKASFDDCDSSKIC